MKVSKITARDACRIALAAQGLGDKHTFAGGSVGGGAAGAEGALAAIRHLGYVQIDTISIVERAHHHVLWSRVPEYRPAMLATLLESRQVFEYWSHAAAILPVEDYRFCLPRMDRLARGARHWFARDRKVMRFVLDRVRAEGPLLARDFEAPRGRKSGPWFDWKPAKRALEQLFMEGELMIRERRGFQKVYDVRDRVLPAGVDRTMPTDLELARHLVARALQAHGIAREEEIRYLRKNLHAPVRQALAELEEAGAIARLTLTGGQNGVAPVARAGKSPFYADARWLRAETESSPCFGPAEPAALRARLLSPFDNAVIQRKRLNLLFDYDYMIECYVPEPKRRFGYFCLPLLYGDRFVGRVDAKVDRTEKRLDALKVIYEPGIKPVGRLKQAVATEIESFARFNGAESVRVLKTEIRK